jgi:hypothetical protein
MTESVFNTALRTVMLLLGNNLTVTRESIDAKVDILLSIPDFSGCDRTALIREIESHYRVRVDDYRIIEKSERKLPWLYSKKSEINWNFWIRYRAYLQDERMFPPETIYKSDLLTDRILDSLFDPTVNAQIDKRGLVVGQVQSGKTSNYTGLICKAIDAGYKLIIVLAGTHNDLRSQTQLRLDEGVLGFDTQHTRAFNQDDFKIGVGKIPFKAVTVAHSLTSSASKGDFSKGAADACGFNFETREPVIAVVKKNSHILKRLEGWLKSKARSEEGDVISSKSLLLIDDEADNASIDTNRAGSDSPTAINGRIRGILGLFRKSAYVGYTATPFANIFIPLDEDNLFPRDFIINVPPPSNYIGPEKVFGFDFQEIYDNQNDVLPIVNRIQDYGSFVPDKHKKGDTLPSFIPESLKKAIRCFILTCAIRRLRGQVDVHNSMLIHVTRFQRWQDCITGLVQQELYRYKIGIDQYDKDVLEEFRSAFELDEEQYRSYRAVSELILNSTLQEIDTHIQCHSWEDVLEQLYHAVSRIEVKAIHGTSGDALEYFEHKKGLYVIAIGGDKLSRGLTLEGLSVSYYLRSSKMYDTLMQMGRWFGYRPGYVDLCRLFTSHELNEWFCHITHASEELREEFDYMAYKASSTPEEFALKVRTHPGVLQISAANKLRMAVTVQVSWSGRLVESYELKNEINTIINNLECTQHFIASLSKSINKKNGYLWYDVPVHKIIEYISFLQTPENLKAYAPRNLVRFIQAQIPNDELTQWRVALISKKMTDTVLDFQSNCETLRTGCIIRRRDKLNSDDNTYYLKKSHLISPDDEFIDLTDSERVRAMDLTRKQREINKKTGEPSYPNGEIVRNEIRDPKKPLLLIYLLDPAGAYSKDKIIPAGLIPFVGYAVSFPGSRKSVNIAYAVHEQLLDQFEYQDDEDKSEYKIEDFTDDED